jgi:imidazolonepropionase-like amidohydrolase
MKFIRLVLLSALAVATPVHAAEGGFAIRNVRLFDGIRTSEHRTVLVRRGVIAAIGGPKLKTAGLTVFDGTGQTLVPGIIDAHVHVSHAAPEKTLAQSARFGVTTDLDMFTDVATLKRLHELSRADLPNLADARSAGIGASAPKGHPSLMDPTASFPTITRPDQAQAFVDARIAEGSDYIKIIAEDGLYIAKDGRIAGKEIPHLDEATIRAVVAAAHRRGKLAVVHVQSERWARVAINAGADGLAHLFIAEHASPDFGRLAKAHHVFVIATLDVEYVQCSRARGPALAADPRISSQLDPSFALGLKISFPSPRSCNGTDDALKQLHAAGVPILVGTDAPVPGTTYGASTPEEMALLVADGLTPTEALRAGTSVTARIFHLNDRGEVKVGKRADLLLVKGDPTRNIGALKDTVAVWKHGMPVERKPVTPDGARS